jgi:hypothetical protein
MNSICGGFFLNEKKRSEFLFDFFKFLFHTQEFFDDFCFFMFLRFSKNFKSFFTELFFCALQSVSFTFNERKYFLEVFDIVDGEESVSFFVFGGLDDVEFFFPKANKRCIHVEHGGDFSNGVVKFNGWFFLVRHASKLIERSSR